MFGGQSAKRILQGRYKISKSLEKELKEYGVKCCRLSPDDDVERFLSKRKQFRAGTYRTLYHRYET